MIRESNTQINQPTPSDPAGPLSPGSSVATATPSASAQPPLSELPPRRRRLPTPSLPQTGGLIRHVITFAGGLLASHGLLEKSDAEQLLGAIAALLAVIWSIYIKRQRTQ